MPEEMTDVQGMILAQLREISGEMRCVPKMQAKLETLSDASRQLETAIRETTAELRTRDEAHGKMIDDLRLRVNELLSGLTVVSNAVHELKGDLTRRVAALEAQVKAMFDTQLKLSEHVRELEKDDADKKDADKASVSELTTKLTAHIEDYKKWLPWFQVIKWAAGIAGGIVVVLIVGAIVWAVIQSGGKW